MHVLRLSCKRNLFASLTHILCASLRTLVNYFSVIDQHKQINSIFSTADKIDTFLISLLINICGNPLEVRHF